MIFGGKELWKKQFKTEDHAAWRSEWREKRNSQFFIIGSKDEASGNQLCQYDGKVLQNSSSLLFRKQVRNPYGNTGGISICVRRLDNALRVEQAISYRFIQEKQTLVCSHNDRESQFIEISNANNGVIGVDLNEHNVGIALIDYEGNLKLSEQFLLMFTRGQASRAKRNYQK